MENPRRTHNGAANVDGAVNNGAVNNGAMDNWTMDNRPMANRTVDHRSMDNWTMTAGSGMRGSVGRRMPAASSVLVMLSQSQARDRER